MDLNEVLIRCREAPLPEAEARAIAAFVFPHLREERLESILRGNYGNECRFFVVTAEADGRLVGSAWIGWGRSGTKIGVLAGVVTAELYRNRGIASCVVENACRLFDEAGGRLLFLGTSHPGAERIYAKLGFRKVTGQIFCRCAAGASSEEGFAPRSAVRTRPASWGDMAAIVPLYLHSHPGVVLDNGIGLLSSRVQPPWRCVRIFWDSWTSVEAGGRWALLENAGGWIVGSLLARPGGTVPGGTPGRFLLDFVLHPDYSSDMAPMLAAFVREIESASRRPCEMLIADGDDWKIRQALSLGFISGGVSGRTVSVTGRDLPLIRFVRSSVS